MTDGKRDVFSYFLDPYNQEPIKTPQMQKNLIGDAMLIVIAGSGPTAPAIAAALFHLAQRPDLIPKLHEELESIDFTPGSTSHSQLATLKLLDAVIDEALRLHPPIRSGPERMTPPEGLQIGKTYIPGNIRIQTPLYPLHRGLFHMRHAMRQDCCTHQRFSRSPKLRQTKRIYTRALALRTIRSGQGRKRLHTFLRQCHILLCRQSSCVAADPAGFGKSRLGIPV